MFIEDSENWATVPGFAHYEANRLGMIKRKDTGVILKPFKRRNSTSRYVRLYTTPGEARERSVASVIWAAFYKRWPDRGLYVCHADGASRIIRSITCSWGLDRMSEKHSGVEMIASGRSYKRKENWFYERLVRNHCPE